MKKYIVSLCVGCVVGGSLLEAGGPVRSQQVQYTPHSAYPAMTGTAAAPVTVNSGAPFVYTLKSTDLDTFLSVAERKLVTDPDMTQECQAVMIRSMTAGQIAPRGIDSSGNAFYDVSGTAITVSATTQEIDNFVFVNGPEDSRLIDKPVKVSQTVTIVATPTPTPTPPTTPKPVKPVAPVAPIQTPI